LLKHFRVRRKGIGTVLGAVYFIMIVITIFNVIMWEANQYSAYQQTVSLMNQDDQDRMSEGLEFPYPVIEYPINETGSIYDLLVRNTGSISVSVARIYVYKMFSNQMWILEKDINFTNGFINSGEINHKIRVVSSHDMRPSDPSVPNFIIYLATERGRTFSTYYPKTVSEYPPPGVNVGWIDIGPLRFIYDYRSLNYTTNTMSTPAPAWILKPYTGTTPLLFSVKVINLSNVSDIWLKRYCVFNCIELSWSGASGKTASFFIVDKLSTQPIPGAMFPYDETSPQILPKAPMPRPPLGGIPVIVKFGAKDWGTANPKPLFTQGGYPMYEYLVLMGFFYVWKGQDYGSTIPFVAIRTNTPT